MFEVDDEPAILDMPEADCLDFQALLDQWVRDGDAFMFVYSISSYDSYRSLSERLRHIYTIHDQEVPILVFGNKIDRGEEKRAVSKDDAEQYAKDHKALFLEGSAKTGENVEEAFRDLLRRTRELGRRSDRREQGKKKTKQQQNEHEQPPPPPPFVRDVDAPQGLSVKRAK